MSEKTATKKVGDTFNPHRRFIGIVVPLPILKLTTISASGKLLYGRLLMYAGKDGECFASRERMAEELGVTVNYLGRLLKELVDAKLIRRIRRGPHRSAACAFLWHECFVDSASLHHQESTPDSASSHPQAKSSTKSLTVHPCTPDSASSHPQAKSSTKSLTVHPCTPDSASSHPQDSASLHRPYKEEEIPLEEIPLRESLSDLDCPSTNRKQRDSQTGDRVITPLKTSKPRKHHELARALSAYLNLPGEEVVEPSDRQVLDVVEAALGKSDTEIIKALKFFYEERGLLPGTSGGPRHYAWFPVVIQDYFCKRDIREESSNPCGYSEWEDRNDLMDARRVTEMASVFDAASEALATPTSESNPQSQGMRSAAELLADGYPGRRGRGAA